MDRFIQFADGQRVCPIGQGTYLMGQEPSKRQSEIAALRMGLEMGMNMIDTAEMYGNEALVAEAIAGMRHQAFLVSKVWPTHASYSGTIAACEQSLQRLRTDYLDLYMLHWRSPYPIEDTIRAMEQLRADGKIRLWGVSNLPLPDMQQIASLPDGATCATDQVQYSLGERGVEWDLLPWMREHHMPMVAYKPLGRGELLNSPTLHAIAARHGVSPAAIAIAWVIRSGDVLTIPKASTPEHVRSNYEALSVCLDSDELQMLDATFPPPATSIPMQTTPPTTVADKAFAQTK